MALFVNTNVAALNGQKNLMDVTSRMNSSFEKLSSGSRINSAKDDAAGLQISDRLTTQIIGLSQASRNANDGISIAQIAEGALGEVTNNIQRMRQLVVQGGNRTLSADDRTALAEEFEKLMTVNNDIADRTAYGTLKILNSDSPETGFQIQSGAFAGEQDVVTTGNAELSALFGKLATDENVAGAFSGITDANLSTYGTAGKMIAAYVATAGTTAVDGATAVADAVDKLFGTAASGLVADLGTKDATGTVNVANLTKILSGSVENDGTDHKIGGASGSLVVTVAAGGLFNVLGVAAADITAITLSDDVISKLENGATDTLLTAMSGLITQVDKQRARLGAEQNGLTSTVRNNTTAVVNVSDSRARIQDTDFAAETAELTRNQIIQQASTTILSQANQLPQTALSLLG